MSWKQDPELATLFRTELVERALRLQGGASAMQNGAVTDELAGSMLREGHTIKGTGRVMGFEAISRAGQLLEQTWRRIQHGDLEPDAELGTALGELAGVLPETVDHDPQEGSPGLQAAIGRLTRLLSRTPAPAPPPPEEVPPEPEVVAAPEEEASSADLGGLLTALESWASAESVLVNAGRLYRLINNVVWIRIEAEAMRAAAITALDGAEGLPIADDIQRLAEMVFGAGKAAGKLEQDALELAAVPIAEITNTLPQLVRYLAKKTGKEIRFEIVGDELAVDRQVLERIADPIRQLVVNAIEHGVEPPVQREAQGKPSTATIAVRASVKDHQLELVISDDGNGIDWEAVQRTAERRGLLPPDREAERESLRALVFSPGFSTAVAESELVGDGSGLTNVAAAVESLHGNLRLETEPGAGTTFTITVPTSTALQRAIIVEAAGQKWGIPEPAVDEIVPLEELSISRTARGEEILWHDQRTPVAEFAAAVGLGEAEAATKALIIYSAVGPVALKVPAVYGLREVAAKELGPLLSGPSHITGAALLGGGDVVLLVDARRLAERARETPVPGGPAPRILVVDDSLGARQVVSGALVSNGFDTKVASSVSEALEMMRTYGADALVVDFAMPDVDGITLVEEVRKVYGDLPIVMLSGVATAEDQVRARASGVDVYFDKADFREGGLAETLRSLLEKKPSRMEEAAR